MGTPVAFYFRIFIFIEQLASLDEYSYLHTLIATSWILIINYYHSSCSLTMIRWWWLILCMWHPFNSSSSIYIIIIIIICITIIIINHHLTNDNDDAWYEWSLHKKDTIHFSLLKQTLSFSQWWLCYKADIFSQPLHSKHNFHINNNDCKDEAR